MSAPSILPELVRAVIVAKPQREGWAIEEAYDLLVPIDPSAQVVATRFRDVLVALSSAPSQLISQAAARMEFSFVSRIVPSLVALRSERQEEVLEAMRRISPEALLVEARLRGRSKEIMRGAPLTEARRGLRLFLEGIDNLFVISYGITKRCGLGCTVVVPPPRSTY